MIVIIISIIITAVICLLGSVVVAQYFVIQNDRRTLNQLIDAVNKINRGEIGYIDIKKVDGTYIIEEIIYHPDIEPAEINDL